MNKKYLEIQKLIQENRSDSRIAEVLSNYHENDIAELLENLSRAERKRIYHVLGIAKTANVFPYFDDPQKYIEEISVEDAAAIISLMDSDDAVDILEQSGSGTKKQDRGQTAWKDRTGRQKADVLR